MYTLSLVILVFSVYRASALISSGNCIQAPVITDFSPADYAGDWFEMTRLPALNELDLTCVRIQYRALNATTLSVHNGGINKISNQSLITEGYAVKGNASTPNVLSVYFPSITGDAPQPYDVWMTDYKSYACVYSCKQIIPNLIKTETMWILSRQPTIDQGLKQKLTSYFKGRGAPADQFLDTYQTNCNYV